MREGTKAAPAAPCCPSHLQGTFPKAGRLRCRRGDASPARSKGRLGLRVNPSAAIIC